MKLRLEKGRIIERNEEEMAAEVRRLEQSSPPEAAHPPTDAYWQNLIIRTNARIDEATSGKALSLSWAWRVAIPGVFAIVSFLIGVHYYVPGQPDERVTVASVLSTLPSAAIDSLLLDPSQIEPTLSVTEIGGEMFDFSREQIADYLAVNGNTSAAADGLTEKEKDEIFALLETHAGVE